MRTRSTANPTLNAGTNHNKADAPVAMPTTRAMDPPAIHATAAKISSRRCSSSRDTAQSYVLRLREAPPRAIRHLRAAEAGPAGHSDPTAMGREDDGETPDPTSTDSA